MPSIQTIADRVGVSYETVSRVLNRGAVSTRADAVRRARQIQKVAGELGYRPNAAARAIAKGRFGAVALLLSAHAGRSTLPGELLDGILDALRACGLHLNIAKLPDEELSDSTVVPKILTTWTSDGLLINYTDHIPAEMVELVKHHRMPAVWINTKRRSNCVYADDLGAGRMATEHLLGLGHRRIAFADYSRAAAAMIDAHYSAVDRAAGYVQAMTAAGLSPRIIRQDQNVSQTAREWFSIEWLKSPDRPTAVVCQSEGTLIPIYAASRALNVAVPSDVSLVNIGSQTLPPIGIRVSTYRIHHDKMGSAAVRMVLESIAQPGQTQAPVCIPCSFLVGESTSTCS